MPQIEEKVQTPNKPKWSCQFSEPKDAKGYTVGEVFTLACQGESVDLKEPLSANMPETMKHSLVLLKPLEMAPGKISYQATTYRVGQFKFPHIDVVDANGGGFISQPVEFKSVSILDPQNPNQQPYGPITPMNMQWPVWLFFSSIVVAMVLLAWSLVFLRRRVQRKNLEKNIKKFQSPMGSYHQFSKDIRLLKREVVFSTRQQWTEAQVASYLEKLDEYYRMYILREFIVPAQTWSVNNIIKHVKRKEGDRFKKYSQEMTKALKELERARGQIPSMTSMDCEQLTKMCSHAVELMWKNKKAVKS